MKFLKQKKHLILFVLVLVIFVGLPLYASAAGLVPCGGTDEKPCTVQDAFYMIARVTNWLIMTAGIFAVYNIVNHSFWLVVSAGNEESIASHKKGILNTLVGLFIVFAAFMFVNTAVNYILRSKCKVDFTSPLNYVTIKDPSKCLQVGQPGYNEINKDITK